MLHVAGQFNQPTQFVGRNEELADITRLLTSTACRLLSLVGPGGIGKTRLAIQSCSVNALHYSNQVCFLSLVPISTPESMILALAESLGIQIEGSQAPLVQIVQYLQNKHMLLVLDNFEHLLDGAEIIADIIHHAPEVTILATSRERLNLVEEWVFNVQGLNYPEVGIIGSPETHQAIALFMNHAQRTSVGFLPTQSDMQSIAHICRLVEGMPLGIELAAAWIRSLTCEEIAQEIEHNLDFLATSKRNIPDRHKSIRAVYAYSYDRLDDAEQRVLRALSVFRSHFDKKAAEHIAGANIVMLSRLVDGSLVHNAGNGRYIVHELLRQFSADYLHENEQEQQDVYRRHSEYYSALLSTYASGVWSDSQHQTTAEIVSVEIDNLLHAWEQAVAQKNLEHLRLSAASLHLPFALQGLYREGEDMYAKAAAAVRSSPESDFQKQVLADLLSYQGHFAIRRGRWEIAESLLNTAYNLATSVGSEIQLAHINSLQGIVAFYQAKFSIAEEYFHEILDRYAHLSSAAENLARYSLSLILFKQGKIEDSFRHAVQSTKSAREMGHLLIVTINLSHLARLYQHKERYQDAITTGHEAYRQAAVLGWQFEIGRALLTLGEVYLANDNPQQARLYIHHALQTAYRIFSHRLLLTILASIADILANDGSLGLASKISLLIINHPSSTAETRIRAQRLQEKVKAIEIGNTLTLETAIQAIYDTSEFSRLQDEKLPDDISVLASEHHQYDASETEMTPLLYFSPSSTHTEMQQQNLVEPLSERELEVLNLVAEGMSNRAIAEHLFLAVGTVKTHVHNICGKLGAANRTEAAAKARQLDLL